eukprot:m.23325 g.23325  ORF g.23325 m.23325 type:complete len:63 (+) comp8963_c0_seq2:537-725(+)
MLSKSPSQFHTYSAKTKEGVQQAFEELAHQILDTPELYQTQEEGLSLNKEEETGALEDMCGC